MARRAEPRAQRAWAAYDEHAATIARFVARRVEPDAVEDIVAETFAIAWRRLPYRDEQPPWLLPWLYATAKRVIHTHRRGHARRTRLFARVSGHTPTEASDPAEQIVGDPQLARAFATLTEVEREAICLIAWEHLSYADAAKVAGCSDATFTTRYSRARKRLAAALAECEERDAIAVSKQRVRC